MIKHSTTLIAVCLILAFSHSIHAQKLYKWVDKNGNISYQDTPPPDTGKVLQESELKRNTAQTPGNESGNAQPVVVYTVENCDACEVLLLRLRQLEVPFTQQSLLNKDIQAEILAVSESITAPTLKIGADFVDDFSDNNLVSKLRQAGLNPVVESDNTAPQNSERSPRSPNEPGATPG